MKITWLKITIFLLLSKTALAGEVVFKEINLPDLGVVYKISKGSYTLDKLWAKNQLEGLYHNAAFRPDGTLDDTAVDQDNELLVSKESQARKACLDLGGDLPTAEDYRELVSLVDRNMALLAEKFPGMSGQYFWTANIYKVFNTERAHNFDGTYGDIEYTERKHYYDNAVRCVTN